MALIFVSSRAFVFIGSDRRLGEFDCTHRHVQIVKARELL